MSFWEAVLTGVVASVIASFIASPIFWYLTFYKSSTKIEFSSKIEKSLAVVDGAGKYRYRVKFINSGKKDLHEVSFLVKLSVRHEKTANFTYLGLGNESRLPILYGREQQTGSSKKGCEIATLYPTQTTFSEFKKSLYADAIREKAKAESLTLDDILEEYKDRCEIVIFAYGNDAVTGARKMYESTVYKYGDNIREGRFSSVHLKDFKIREYEEYVYNSLKLTSGSPDTDQDESENDY